MTRNDNRVRLTPLAWTRPFSCPRGTLTNVLAISVVLPEDTAANDRIVKMTEYAERPSLCCDVLLDQTTRAARPYQREPGGARTASAHTGGALRLDAIAIAAPLADLYLGLMVPEHA